MVKTEIIEVLKSYIYLLKSEGIIVNKAFLYGSHLSGTATGESDIDLLIVTENESDDYLVGKAWKLTKKINPRIEPLLIGANRFYGNDDSPLVDSIKKTGMEIL